MADLRAELRRVLEATVELAERAEIHPVHAAAASPVENPVTEIGAFP